MKVIKIFVGIFLLLLITACGNSEQVTDSGNNIVSKSEGEAYALKLVHGYPTASFMHTFMEWYSDEVEKRSDGRIQIEIYPNGQLMPVDQEVPSILQGQIDMTHTTSPVLASIDPIWNFYELPFVFDFDPKNPSVFLKDRMEFNNNEKGGKEIVKRMEEQGLKVLSFAFIDMFGSVYATDEQNLIKGPESAKGLKLRTPGGIVGPETVKSIGASSVTIAGAEVITALQQNTVDGLLTTPIYAADAKLPIKSSSLVPLINSVTPLIISLEKFNSLPSDLQGILVQAGSELEEHAMQKVEEKARTAYKNLENEGVKIYYPTEKEIFEWKEATKPAREVFVKQVNGGQELLNIISN